MLYLLLAILTTSMISVIMRFSTGQVKNNATMLAVNYLVCMILAALHTGLDRLFPAVPDLPKTLGIGAVNGFMYLLGFVLMRRNTQLNGVVLTSIFMKLSLMIPILLSIFLFGETPTVFQLVGFAVAIASIVLINSDNSSPVMNSRTALIVLLLLGGGGDTMSKIFEQVGNSAYSENFLLYTFISATILAIALAVFKKEQPCKKDLLFGVLIGIPNFFCARFLLMSLTQLPGVLVFPTLCVGSILVVTLAGLLIFKERLGKQQWIAMGAILGALVLLNI